MKSLPPNSEAFGDAGRKGATVKYIRGSIRLIGGLIQKGPEEQPNMEVPLTFSIVD